MATSDVRVLERGLERLQTIGWGQGDCILTDDEAEPGKSGSVASSYPVVGFCMVGSLATRSEVAQRSMVTVDRPWRRRVMRILADAIQEQYPHATTAHTYGVPREKWDSECLVDYIATFNDKGERTLEDVVKVYKAAITAAQQKAAIKAARAGVSEADLATAGD